MPSSVTRFLLCLFALTCGLTTPAAAQSPPAQTPPVDGPSTLIVFDGSGSMWGRLDGDKKQSKLELARDALRTGLAKATPPLRYGLMSFGHRRGGDCSDIEIISPLGPAGDPARVMTPLEKLNPRGKGPIAAAIKEAAKALGPATQASILLIHDNADNCRQDACEAATEIAAAYPKLKIHLVSLGIEKDELARVSCIARSTGGQLFDAKDAASVAPAIADAMKLALFDTAPSAASGPAAAAVPPAAPAAAPSGPPRLKLTARLGPASAPLGVPVRWRIFRPGSDAALLDTSGPDLVAPVDPGPYIVEGRIGFVTARQQVTAAAQGQTLVDLPLDAATVRLRIADLKDGQVAASTLVTLRQAAGANPPARPLWIGRAQDVDFVLPAGAYTLHIQDSLVERDEPLVLAAGDMINRDVVLGAGRLELTAVAKPDGPALEGVTFLVAKDDPDAPGGRREIARSAALRPTFALPAGTYYVTARSGTAEVRQRIGIGAGDTIKRAISLGLAKVLVSAEVAAAGGSGKPGAKNPEPGPKLPIQTRILSLEGEPREIARATAVAPEFTLAAGRYRIEAAIGTVNVKAVQDIDIEGGNTRRVVMKLDASTVTLRLAGPSATEATWELTDSQGVQLVRSSLAAPRVVLAPGRYTAKCTVQGRVLEKSVDIATDGQPRSIEFVLP